MRLLIVSITLFSMLAITGCGRNVFVSNDDYDRVWMASQTVMNRHGLIVKQRRIESDTLVAVSREADYGSDKGRTKVKVNVIMDEDGYYAPHVKASEELELFGRWQEVSRNRTMETRLHNEIMDVLNGQINTYKGDGWQPVMNQEEGSRSAEPTKYSGVATESETEEVQALDFSPETW